MVVIGKLRKKGYIIKRNRYLHSNNCQFNGFCYSIGFDM